MNVTSIEFTMREVKVMQVMTRRRKCVVRYCAVIPFPEGVAFTDMLNAGTYTAWMEKVFIPASSRVVVSVPRQVVSMHAHVVPSRTPKEIANFIALEVDTMLPSLRDEVAFAHAVNIIPSLHTTGVTIAYIKQEILSKLYDRLHVFKVQDAAITVNSFGSMFWYQQYMRQKKMFPGRAWGHIAGDRSGAHCVYIDAQGRFMSRVVDGDGVEASVCAQRVYDCFTKMREHSDPDEETKVLITGDDRYTAAMRSMFSMSERYLVMAEGSVSLCFYPSAGKNKVAIFSLHQGVGCAALSTKILPLFTDVKCHDERMSAVCQRVARSVTAGGIICLFMAQCALFFMNDLVARQRGEVQRYRERLEKNIAIIKKGFDRSQAGNAYAAMDSNAAHVFQALQKNRADNMYFLSLSYMDADMLRVEGYTRDMASVTRFIKNMENDPVFEGVVLTMLRRDDVSADAYVRFALECSLHALEKG